MTIRIQPVWKLRVLRVSKLGNLYNCLRIQEHYEIDSSPVSVALLRVDLLIRVGGGPPRPLPLPPPTTVEEGQRQHQHPERCVRRRKGRRRRWNPAVAVARVIEEGRRQSPLGWRRRGSCGSLKRVDLNTGNNGWASPPGDVFNVRGRNYFARRQKSPANPAYLLSPLGVDWLRSTGRLDDVLGRQDNLVAGALRRAQSRGESLKAFLVAVNLQIPGRDHHSAVFYFGSDEPLPPGSLLFRFVNGDDEFRNARFKIVNRIVRGPWIVRAAVGNYAACLLGRALQIRYVRGANYLEIDVDIGSSALANAILHLALGYVTTVTIDMGFLVEAQAEEELPERLIGAVRIAHMEMGSAAPIGIAESAMATASSAKHHHAKGGGRSLSKVKHVDKDGSVAE